MKILITGVTGYIGGSVAKVLVDRGHQVSGLARSEEHSAKLKQLGIEPIIGSMADEELLVKAASAVDGVVNCADSDNAFAVSTIVQALCGTSKFFIHTSGSSTVADRAAGEASDKVFHEDIPPDPVVEKAGRVAIDRYILSAALKNVRSIVICPCLIYGDGLGIKKDSQQIPMLIECAKKSGSGRYIGKGLNIWSNVHIEDLAELYALVVEKGTAGSYFYAENGEASMKDVAVSISKLLGFSGKTESMPISEAVKKWGPGAAYFALSSNSRINADKARKMLGWKPSKRPLLDDIEKGSYTKHVVTA